MDQECLRYLIQICDEMGMPTEKYKTALRKLERMAEAQEEQRQMMQDQNGEGAGFEMFPGDGADVMSSLPGLGGMGNRPPQYMTSPQIDELPPEPISVDDGAPMQKTKKKLAAKPQKVVDDDDDWGGDDLGDDLLP
jgi:hypothetical protein